MAKEKIISKVIPLTFGVLAFVLLIGYLVFAWQEPTQPPPGGNVPAPINVGTTSQYKAGGLRIGGAFQSDSIGVFNSGLKIGNSPFGEAGVIRWSGTDFQGYTGSSWLSLTAGGGGVSLDRVVRLEKCLAQGINNVLCKKIDGSGNCVNQASEEDLYSECPSGEKCNGSGNCGKALSSSCSASTQCLSGYCVNGVCCDSACNDKTCQRCDSYSINGAGYCGYVNSSSTDPDNECTQGSTASDGCRSNYCNGSGYSCGVQISGKGGCPACQYCSDSDIACESISANTDPYNECGGSSCCGYCNGAGVCAYVSKGSTCTSPGDSCVETYYHCDGSGNCSRKALGEPCTTADECASGYCYVDEDGDRYAPSSGTTKCQANSQLAGTDCNDASSNAYPGNTFCGAADGIDNNCDGTVDNCCSTYCSSPYTGYNCFVSASTCGCTGVTCTFIFDGCMSSNPAGDTAYKCCQNPAGGDCRMGNCYTQSCCAGYSCNGWK